MKDVIPDNSTNEELTRYLLGELSEAEQTELEVRYFADPRLFAELCAWRSNLFDEYVGGELSPPMRIRFEAAIENSWITNERIRFAETMQQAVETRRATATSHSARRSLGSFTTNYRKPIVAAALLLMILTATWLILRVFS
jgi:anti-sigma factor RsiW